MAYRRAVMEMKAFPKSDDFAVLLDLTESKIGTPPTRSEQHKVDVMNLLYIPRLHMEHPLQQDVVFCRFGAIYLDSLVEKYLDPPKPSTASVWEKSIALLDMELANAYGFMLIHLNGTPYFNKFFRLSTQYDVRRKLVETLLQRLAGRTAEWEARIHDPRAEQQGGIAVSSMIHDFCQLLTSLLLFHHEDDVREINKTPMVQHLHHFLRMWNDRYALQGDAISDGKNKKGLTEAQIEEKKKQWPAYHLSMVLNGGNNEKELQAITAARMAKGGMSRCAMDGCTRHMAVDGGALLQCSRCGTVRYCSEDHQRLAWTYKATMHKEMCHKTKY